MKITIASATAFEIQQDLLHSSVHDVQFLNTGIGILASAVSLTQHIFQHKPDLIIQAGIAGCFDNTFSLGDVVVVEKEYMGDLGVWENGKWNDLFDMNFLKDSEAPYTNRGLQNQNVLSLNVLNLPLVNGVTVNEISTNIQTITMLKEKYKAVVESMEGASLHYVGRLFSVPFIQVRSLSNYVGERDKKNWKIKEAIENVNEAVKNVLKLL